MAHRISKRAERDLVDIYLWTHQAFGENQAAKYLLELDSVFRMIGENPRIGRPFDDHTRRYVHGRHVIFYRIAGATVVVGRILHGARSHPRPD